MVSVLCFYGYCMSRVASCIVSHWFMSIHLSMIECDSSLSITLVLSRAACVWLFIFTTTLVYLCLVFCCGECVLMLSHGRNSRLLRGQSIQCVFVVYARRYPSHIYRLICTVSSILVFLYIWFSPLYISFTRGYHTYLVYFAIIIMVCKTTNIALECSGCCHSFALYYLYGTQYSLK